MGNFEVFDLQGRFVGVVTTHGVLPQHDRTAMEWNREVCPPRHRESWSNFEKARLESALNDFIRDSATKHGRTEAAIKGRIRKTIPRYY